MKYVLNFIAVLITLLFWVSSTQAASYKPVLYLQTTATETAVANQQVVQMVFNTMGNDIDTLQTDIVLQGKIDPETIKLEDLIVHKTFLVSAGMELVETSSRVNTDGSITVRVKFAAKSGGFYDEGSAAIPLLNLKFVTLNPEQTHAYMSETVLSASDEIILGEVTHLKTNPLVLLNKVPDPKPTPTSITLQPVITQTSPQPTTEATSNLVATKSSEHTTQPAATTTPEPTSNLETKTSSTPTTELIEKVDIQEEKEANKPQKPAVVKTTSEVGKVIKTFFNNFKKIFSLNRIDILSNNR